MHLKITCYRTSAGGETHSAYEGNMEDQTMDVSQSKLTASGDGTVFTRGWQNVPGGLKGEIVMAEEHSYHASLFIKFNGIDDEMSKRGKTSY